MAAMPDAEGRRTWAFRLNGCAPRGAGFYQAVPLGCDNKRRIGRGAAESSSPIWSAPSIQLLRNEEARPRATAERLERVVVSSTGAAWNAHHKPASLPDLDALMTRIGREKCGGLELHLRIVRALKDFNRTNTFATHHEASISRHGVYFHAGRPLVPIVGYEIEQPVAPGLSGRKIFHAAGVRPRPHLDVHCASRANRKARRFSTFRVSLANIAARSFKIALSRFFASSARAIAWRRASSYL